MNISFYQTIRCSERVVYIQKTSLNYITLRLIFIQLERDHKNGKTLPYNTVSFS